MIQREFIFEDQMRMSEGIGDIEDIRQFLLMRIPYAIKVERANTADDKNGTDYWVTDKFGHRYSVDLKARDRDFGKDDYALETWSVIGKKIGWTRDPSKRTDYIFWYWKDTKRWALVPFLPLCSIFENRWEEWRKKYTPYPQYTRTDKGGWYSECIFVPSRIVWGAMFTVFGGKIA